MVQRQVNDGGNPHQRRDEMRPHAAGNDRVHITLCPIDCAGNEQVPVVWASLRWLARVAWRCVVPSSSGRRSSVLSLLAPLLGLGAATSILWAVGYASLYYLTPYVQDWRSGTVRHEAVTCRDFRVDNSIANSSKGNARVMDEFEVASADGSSWKYREEKSWMDRKVEAGEQPYATVIEACRSEGAEIGISVYPHSGTIIEAWKVN